jgi:hypothetical protein
LQVNQSRRLEHEEALRIEKNTEISAIKNAELKRLETEIIKLYGEIERINVYFNFFLFYFFFLFISRMNYRIVLLVNFFLKCL